MPPAQVKDRMIALDARKTELESLIGSESAPQPVLLHSEISGSDKLDRFTETGANLGSLGVFDAKFLIRHMQANAKMFDKFGA